MKILHVLRTYHPSSGGMYEVVKQISEQLAKNGHDITIATSKVPEISNHESSKIKIIEFSVSGNLVHGLNGEIEKYQNFVINGNFDIVTVFAAQQVMADALLEVLPKIKAKKVFVPTGFSAFYIPEYQEYFKKMVDWLNDFDMNVFLSNDYRDINLARKNNIEKTTLIPNGASRKEFEKPSQIDIKKILSIEESSFLILHVGSHTGQKGHKEAIKIFKNAKLKDACLLIIGNDGHCRTTCETSAKKINRSNDFLKYNKKIIVKPLDRQHTLEAYKKADIFLFPSNIECSPIVLFECMAAGLPFLTTEAGNAKEIIQWSNGGLLLPTKKNIFLDNFFLSKIKKIVKKIIGRIDNDYQFCRAEIDGSVKILEDLYHNKNKRVKLAEAGHQAWQEKFTWEKISEQYENLYKKLLS